MCWVVTASAALVAMAASTALPPARSTPMPAPDARWSTLQTMPLRARRVWNGTSGAGTPADRTGHTWQVEDHRLRSMLRALRSVVGDEHVLVDPDVVASHVVDWTGGFVGSSPAVVRPGSTDEVAEVVAACRRDRIALVPQGGNTGLVGGGVPLAGEVVLSTSRLAGITEVDTDAGQLTAGAGETLAAVQRAAADAGWRYGVDLAARDSATIGGTVATNAGGLRVLRHGTTRRQLLGVEAVLGAFVAGVLLGRSRLRSHKVIEPVESLTTTFLAPVFFATAGLRVDLGLLGDPEVLLWAGIVLAAASLAKFAGSLAAAKIAGLPNREGAALGIGLNARGALEIVIATVGLSLGVLNQASYTVIVLMALATSMAAPPLLRRVLSGWAGTDEEQERLLREETLAANIIVRDEPVLIPTRGGMNSIMAAQLVDLAWPKEVGVTLATVDATGDAPNLRVLEDVLHLRSVERRLLGDDDVVDALVEELRLGYGTAVIGTSSPDGDRVLSPIAEELALRSPVPVTVVRRGLDVTSRLPPAYGRVLIPVTGTPSSIAAQEVGLAISGAIGTEAILTHVVHHDGGEEPDDDATRRTRRWGGPDVLHRGGDSTRIAGQQMLDDAAARAATVGARAITAITDAESTAAGILQLVELHETDLVIVGATRRDVDGRLFLGHTVERLLRRCGATIVVVVSPSDRSGPPDA
ncbi:MAG TPA: hypothetical protein DCS55_01555 [Acidimicrobiaceae bacterium]|nr:hypothetical protein [Acidimicrobiaceae bacterium]